MMIVRNIKKLQSRGYYDKTNLLTGYNWGSGFRCFDFDLTLFEPSDMPSEMFVVV